MRSRIAMIAIKNLLMLSSIQEEKCLKFMEDGHVTPVIEKSLKHMIVGVHKLINMLEFSIHMGEPNPFVDVKSVRSVTINQKITEVSIVKTNILGVYFEG